MTDSDNSREWASQAYAILKKQQAEQKEAEQKEGFSDTLNLKNTPLSFNNDNEAELGEFDDDFTWSAMVLAAQGKKINQISIDEIDWLT